MSKNPKIEWLLWIPIIMVVIAGLYLGWVFWNALAGATDY